MAWVFHSAHEAFEKYREMWDEINRAHGNHILLDSAFVQRLIRYFASPDVLLGTSTDPADPGMALVRQVRRGFWQTFQPPQAPLGLILLGNRDNAPHHIESLLHGLPGYALGFAILQQDPDFTAFLDLPHYRPVELVEHIRTPRLVLTGTFEEYWRGRHRNVVRNLSRRRRRLAERGVHLALIADREPGRVAHCIREYGRLESSGWKERGGTAVSADNPQGLFYQDVLEHFCGQGEGVIYRLLANDQAVACDLFLERDGMTIDLKTTYDEHFSPFSVGSLIHEEILKRLFGEGRVKVVEYYGRVGEWHTQWTDDIRTLFHINCFRNRLVSVTRRFVKASSPLLARRFP